MNVIVTASGERMPATKQRPTSAGLALYELAARWLLHARAAEGDPLLNNNALDILLDPKDLQAHERTNKASDPGALSFCGDWVIVATLRLKVRKTLNRQQVQMFAELATYWRYRADHIDVIELLGDIEDKKETLLACASDLDSLVTELKALRLAA